MIKPKNKQDNVLKTSWVEVPAPLTEKERQFVLDNWRLSESHYEAELEEFWKQNPRPKERINLLDPQLQQQIAEQKLDQEDDQEQRFQPVGLKKTPMTGLHGLVQSTDEDEDAKRLRESARRYTQSKEGIQRRKKLDERYAEQRRMERKDPPRDRDR